MEERAQSLRNLVADQVEKSLTPEELDSDDPFVMVHTAMLAVHHALGLIAEDRERIAALEAEVSALRARTLPRVGH